MSALDKQTGGNHYKSFAIQPIEFTMKNGLGFIEGNIIKYVTRHKLKNKAEDIQKVKHYAELLLELEYGIKPLKIETRPTAEELIENAFKNIIDEPATPEELSASDLAAQVFNHPMKPLIMKRIINEMLNQGQFNGLESIVNSAVSNHKDVNELHSVFLEIAKRDHNHGL